MTTHYTTDLEIETAKNPEILERLLVDHVTIGKNFEKETGDLSFLNAVSVARSMCECVRVFSDSKIAPTVARAVAASFATLAEEITAKTLESKDRDYRRRWSSIAASFCGFRRACERLAEIFRNGMESEKC